MSRQQFSSNNSKVKIFSFQKSGSTASFSPAANWSGLKRPSWKLNNGIDTSLIAGSILSYTGFTFDSNIRNIELRSNSFANIVQILMNGNNIYGHVDLSIFNESPFLNGSIALNDNIGITGITNPPIYNFSTLINYNSFNCNIIGDLNMAPISGDITNFLTYSNPSLTSITFSNTTNITGQLFAYNCDITGNFNSRFSGTTFQVQGNSKLTGITHITSSKNINLYNASNCDLTGNLDLTMLTNLGGLFLVFSNPNLTGISHTYSSNNFNSYIATSCNLIGNLNLSMFPNLGGSFSLSSNINLTGITHTASIRNFSEYTVQQCNLIGNHDISMLQNLGGRIGLSSNPLLTGVTLTTASTQSVNIFTINDCDIQGIIDLTPFTGFGSITSGSSSQIKINSNSGITNFIFPESNNLYYINIANNAANSAFSMFNCSLGYIDFKPLSGCTLISGATVGVPRFELYNNAMTTSDVNQILSDFDLISTLNYSGWTATSGTTGGYINISANSAPDGSSGGYNGTGATVNLVSKGWTVITD